MLPLSPEATRAAMQANANHLFHELGVSTKFVLVGVAIEGIEYAVGIAGWSLRKILGRRAAADIKEVNKVFPALWFSRDEPLPHTWARFHKVVKFTAFVGLVLVVAGVGGELIFADKLQIANNDIQAFDEVRLGAEEKEAGRFRKEAALIQAKVAWRSLTSSQKEAIGSALSHSPKLTVSVGYEGAGGENSDFASDIADALQASHVLKVVPIDPSGVMHTRTPTPRKGHILPRVETGVLVAPTDDKPSKSLARAISTQLNDLGFDARVGKPEKLPMSQVEVDVGPRPIGPQGEYKLQAEQEVKSSNNAKAQR